MKKEEYYKQIKNNPLREKTADFSLRIINLYKYLTDEFNDYVISNQVLRSGTSVGANVAEAIYAQTKRDFVTKLSISLKEASETEYWFDLLYRSGYIKEKEFESLLSDAEEIRKMLVSSIKTSKKSINDKK
jgi:four helix bundle protein